jgi:hypothetical protein
MDLAKLNIESHQYNQQTYPPTSFLVTNKN